MAKNIIKFTAVPYEVNGHTGYRPQLENQTPVSDLDFCKEVVTEKRLAMSADELLHAIEMLGEVGPAKVAADGRPRAITKLLKYNRFAQGNLESPTSAWNETCRAYVKPQLLSEGTKEIDATFQNVNEGIGVKLNYVAWLGAKTVTNVIKAGKAFAAYGNHMEWLAGDTATLTVGTTAYALTCTESDVAHAVFSWPAGLNPEAGTQAEFVMKSRGGIEEGEVYTSKKTVTILASDGPEISGVKQDDLADGHLKFLGGSVTISGFGLRLEIEDSLKIEMYSGETLDATNNIIGNVTTSSLNSIVLSSIPNNSGKDASYWENRDSVLVLTKDGVRYTYPVHFDPSV